MSVGLHLDDTALVRIIDGEAADRENAASHLDLCGTCRFRLRRMKAQSDRLARLLEHTAAALPPPAYDADFLEILHGGGVRGRDAAVAADGRGHRARTAGRSRMMRRWAAAAAFAGLLLSVSPVRAWVLRQARDGWVWMTGRSEASAVVEPRLDAPTEVRTRVSGPVLRVRATAEGVPDTVLVHITTEALARASLRGGGPGAEVVVRADGFDVTAPTGVVLDVWVPPTVSEVGILVDGVERAHRSLEELRRGTWLVTLGRSPKR